MSTPKRRKQDREKLLAGDKGKFVQVIATVAALIMVTLNQYTEPDINDLFIWAMFGLAYGARPETFNSFLGGRK